MTFYIGAFAVCAAITAVLCLATSFFMSHFVRPWLDRLSDYLALRFPTWFGTPIRQETSAERRFREVVDTSMRTMFDEALTELRRSHDR